MRVLVTRPRRDAEKTAAALRARGHEVVISPVLEIVGAETRSANDPACNAVLATSTHAFEFIDPALARVLARLPLFVVGDRTAEAARTSGFSPPMAVATNAAALVPEVAARLRPPARLAYLAGRDRKPDLETALQDLGFELDVRVVYEARATARLTSEALETLRSGRLDAVLHYSRRSADLFLRQVETAGLKREASALRHVCISAEAALPFGPRAAIAATPDSKGLFAALEAV